MKVAYRTHMTTNAMVVGSTRGYDEGNELFLFPRTVRQIASLSSFTKHAVSRIAESGE